MIYECLNCVAEEINDFLKLRFKVSEAKVVITSLVNQDGSVAISGENKIALTLINIEKEQAKTAVNHTLKVIPNQAASVNVNLQILFAVYFSGNNYPEGLKFLSLLISFLQKKPNFNRSNTPGLPSGVEKLTFDLETIGVEKLSNIWSMLGAKYLPSVLYKVRMLTFDEATAVEYRPVIKGVSSISNPIPN